MNAITKVLERMAAYGDAEALYHNGAVLSYTSFLALKDKILADLPKYGVSPGTVCGVLGEFSPNTCALLFALIEKGAILVPFIRASQSEIGSFSEIAGVQVLLTIDPVSDEISAEKISPK